MALDTHTSRDVARNAGTNFEPKWLGRVRVDAAATRRRSQTLVARRAVKREWQAAWLLRAVTCLDLTTLSGDDTEGSVQRLCGKALNPVRNDLLDQIGVQSESIRVAAVCVYHNLVPMAEEILRDSPVGIAAVAAGFPAGQIGLEMKANEIRSCLAAGATEIDIVISRGLVLRGRWQQLHDEVSHLREVCGEARMKVILGAGELGTLDNVARAGLVSMMAGADFIKTSTGKETVNATLPIGLTMLRVIRHFYELTGYKVGFKPAGGIRTAKQALDWQVLMKEELDGDWLHPHLFRLGASSLLTDIERQISHFVTGRYPAPHHFAMQ